MHEQALTVMPSHFTAHWLAPLLLLPALATASASSPEQASNPLVDQQRRLWDDTERQQRLRELQRQPAAASQDTPALATPRSPAHPEHCWPVQGLKLTGQRLLDAQTLQHSAQPWLSTCMSIEAINGLLAALTVRYVEAGLIAARPYVATVPQPGQALHVQIFEGIVEAIELTGADLPLSLANAFPGMIGQPLRLSDLENGLDQLNRLRSFDLQVDIHPGDTEGGTRLVLTPRNLPTRWQVASVVDNLGRDTSGRHNGSLNLAMDSPLALNDFFSLGAGKTLDGQPGYNRQYSLYYQIPHGRWKLDLSASRLRSRSALPNGHQFTQSHTSLGLKLDRRLWRNQHTLLNASLRLGQRSTDNRYERVSLRGMDLTIVEAGLDVVQFQGPRTVAAYLGISHGLGWLGADQRQPSYAAVAAAQPRFEKYQANFMQSTWLAALEQNWRWQSELSLQYSPDPLPDSEQLRLAGSSQVRGFRLDSQPMSRGAVLRNSLSTPRTVAPGLMLTPQASLDMGWGQHSYALRQTQRAVGTSLGATLAWRDGELAMHYQRGLARSASSGLEPGFWEMALTQRF